MDKSGIKSKLCSRKLWAAVAAVVVAVLTVVFKSELSAQAVDIIVGAIGALCAYIFGEGAVDVARIIGGRSGGADSQGGMDGGGDNGSQSGMDGAVTDNSSGGFGGTEE